jgi:hypothetical protein
MKVKTKYGESRLLPILLLLVLLCPASTYALDVNGVIDSDSRWTMADSPIRVIGDVFVAQGASLTVDPGAEVVFQTRPDTTRGYNLTVEGTLVADGDPVQPIVFTAQDTGFPWGTIVFTDTSQDWDDDQATGSSLTYCVVEYGGNAPDYDAMIATVNAMPRIAHNAIRFSSSGGIGALAGDGAVSISGNLDVTGNQIYGNPTGLFFSAEGGSIQDNYFLNNGRAVDIATQSNDVAVSENTIAGSSGELFGSGIRVQLGAPASGIAAYQWVQTAGPAVELQNANSARASFTAPDPGNDIYTLGFDLTVTGMSGLQATETTEVTVIGAIEPPEAEAGANQNAQLNEPPEDPTDPPPLVEVTLNGNGSHDPFSGIAGYRWQQTAGRSVSLQTPNAATTTFLVPAATTAGEEMTFQLTVTNRGGLQDTDTVDIRFYEDNVYPVAVAGEDFNAMQGDTVNLDGSASTDPDGGITAYLWVQTGGTPVDFFNVNTAKPFFVAPDVGDAGETLTFALGVLDTDGLQDADEISIHIKGTTVAVPGEDQTVSAGDAVTLDGSSSADVTVAADITIQSNTIDSDSAESGQVAVTALENAAYSLLFTENNITFSENPGFSIYLYDWQAETDAIDMAGNWWGTTDTDAIDALIVDQQDDVGLPPVTYQPFASQAIDGSGSELSYPPLANAGADLTSAVDLKVTLDGSGSYDPDGIGTYRWEQIEGTAVTIADAQQAVASFIAPSGGSDGIELSFRLTMTTGGPFEHSDDVVVTISPDEPVPVVEVGSGCFIDAAAGQFSHVRKYSPMMIFSGLLFGLVWALRRRAAASIGCLVLVSFFVAAEAQAGFFAVGGGDGGDAEQYNVTVEAGAKDIPAGKLDLMFAFGIPFIPHGDENLPGETIAFPCPNDDCRPLEAVRKGTEVGFYGKLGVELGSSNLYINAIGGFTVYTESELSQSVATGAFYEESSDTKLEPMYGGGLSYFPDYFDWPVMFQVDYDVTRGVTGTIGWYW